MSKIPCLVLTYHDLDSIKTTIGCLLQETRSLDLIVIENPSEFTSSCIKPFMLDLVRSGSVSQYFLFDTNITNNALEVVLESGHLDLARSDYVMVTDGDLLVQNEDWLGEQVGIMNRHKDIFACGIRLDMTNLPIQTFPEAPDWLPPVRSESELYTEVATGAHLLLMRTADVISFLKYRRKHNVRFLDSVLCDYCYRVLKKKWVRTKRSTARHLTWDRYCDLDHPYTKLKLARSFEETWKHHAYSGYERYTVHGIDRHASTEQVNRNKSLRQARDLWKRARKWRSILLPRTSNR